MADAGFGGVQQATTPVASYAYDAFGQRLLKSLPGSPATTILYQYDLAGHQIEDSDISTGTPNPQADYIYLGGRPVALVLGGALYFYQDDRLGTPQLVTNGSAAVQWAGNYEPFGGVGITGSITQNLRLPGQYADAETGWYNNGFRTYAPDLGRYIQADHVGLAGGLNPYRYVEGNPISFTDRAGSYPIFPQNLGPPSPPSLAGGNGSNCMNPGGQPGNPNIVLTGSTPSGITYNNKIARQMARRGWTPDQIDEAARSGNRIAAINKATGGPATRYVNPTTGQSVVIDNTTNEVIQVGGPGFSFGPGSGDVPGAEITPAPEPVVPAAPEPLPVIPGPDVPIIVPE